MLRMNSLTRILIVLCVTTVGIVAPASAQRKPVSDASVAVQAKEIFVKGMTRAYIGDNESAIGFFERALELRPGEGAILAALAEAHEAEGDMTTALFYAARAVEASPTEASTYRHLAGLQITAGETAAAVSSYQRLLELTPRDLRALTSLARVQQELGQYEDAIETYDRLLDEVGESGVIRTRMLGVYQRLGDTEGMIRTVEALVELEPTNPTFQRELADLYERVGRTEAAVEALEALVAAQPSNTDAVRNLADLYRALGDHGRADALMSAFDETPATSDAMLARAADYYIRADDDPEAAATARRLLEAVVERGEADASSLLMLGDLRYRAGDWAEAADALAPALEDDPTNIAGWAQLIAASLQAGDTDAAVDAAEESTLLFPGQYALIRIAALAHAEAGNDREALRHFEEALDLLGDENPEDELERSALLANTGRMHARLGDDARAEAAYGGALELDNDNALALGSYAALLVRRGERLDAAARMARRAVDLDPANATLIEYLGDVEAARGRTDEARQHWQSALDLDPGNAQLQEKLNDTP